ncbi:radical SAM protein [Caproicibacterium sp. BJN0003]|uniref:radical SAM protein n=1 Tax=Caproicibacterium sp. BJN0003 TaxID=2994078 RepID=UPI00224F3957|nr:radical SAM protein [Caproicibacterium sp. BJN0003]UZT82609.1 radical SAM protein [Caproicibacterium sp. BJN0003]
MESSWNLETYLANGVESIVKEILRATLKDPKESLFMAAFARSSKAGTARREELEAQGHHIPPFLIASISSLCNLHCKGCYARSNGTCTEDLPAGLLSSKDWQRIFKEAESLGIGFILLAGGEPFMRRDVLEEAGKIPNILFPIFTNGTLMNESSLTLLKRCRNLVPIFSIEGEQKKNDLRRGDGVYQKVTDAMETMKKERLLFGASVTVTTQNLTEVTGDKFLQDLESCGCKIIIFVEYVPVTEDSRALAPGENERAYLSSRLSMLRNSDFSPVLISFPGDEKSSGGCLAAGRGFFHVDPCGDVQPCPFSPYSDRNLKEISLLEALESPFFKDLKQHDVLKDEHAGGCVLFERRNQVEEILQSEL